MPPWHTPRSGSAAFRVRGRGRAPDGYGSQSVGNGDVCGELLEEYARRIAGWLPENMLSVRGKLEPAAFELT
jgi:hypothetical protein